ncbi:hypothetical protein KFK09_022915 [Dendrobium nobile]|uniref:Uncharacterized protein n=1 Tax=Dendrobium nobile TaxID=94219 RepID=A0A8T3AR73_DENNO|nr:hypothetical protein KFK09_022915 [Dendrobium nobile]
MQASDRFNINSQLEHLQAKYVGTGHSDMNRFEWAVNIQRDSYHLMLVTTPFWHTLPLRKMNQLEESAIILCRKCCCPVVFLRRGKKTEDAGRLTRLWTKKLCCIACEREAIDERIVVLRNKVCSFGVYVV